MTIFETKFKTKPAQKFLETLKDIKRMIDSGQYSDKDIDRYVIQRGYEPKSFITAAKKLHEATKNISSPIEILEANRQATERGLIKGLTLGFYEPPRTELEKKVLLPGESEAIVNVGELFGVPGGWKALTHIGTITARKVFPKAVSEFYKLPILRKELLKAHTIGQTIGGLAIGEKIKENIEERKPISEGLPESYITGVAFGNLMGALGIPGATRREAKEIIKKRLQQIKQLEKKEEIRPIILKTIEDLKELKEKPIVVETLEDLKKLEEEPKPLEVVATERELILPSEILKKLEKIKEIEGKTERKVELKIGEPLPKSILKDISGTEEYKLKVEKELLQAKQKQKLVEETEALKKLGFDERDIDYMTPKIRAEVIAKQLPSSEIEIIGDPGGIKFWRYKFTPEEKVSVVEELPKKEMKAIGEDKKLVDLGYNEKDIQRLSVEAKNQIITDNISRKDISILSSGEIKIFPPKEIKLKEVPIMEEKPVNVIGIEREILSKTGLSDEEIVKYVRHTKVNGEKLRSYATNVMQGKMNIDEAVNKVKQDYKKIKLVEDKLTIKTKPEISIEDQDIVNFYTNLAQRISKEDFIQAVNEGTGITYRIKDKVYTPKDFKRVIKEDIETFYNKINKKKQERKELLKKVGAKIERKTSRKIEQSIKREQAISTIFKEIMKDLGTITPLGGSLETPELAIARELARKRLVKNVGILVEEAKVKGEDIEEYLVKQGLTKAYIQQLKDLAILQEKEEGKLDINKVILPPEVVERLEVQKIKSIQPTDKRQLNMTLKLGEKVDTTIADDHRILKKLGYEINKIIGEKQPTVEMIYIKADLLRNMKGTQEKIIESQKRDLIQKIIKNDISLVDFDDYLRAKHTPSRNQVMYERAIERGEIEPSKQLSGYSDEWAIAKIKELQAKYKDKFEIIENELFPIIERIGQENLEFAYNPYKFDPLLFSPENKLLTENEYIAIKNIPWTYYAPFYRAIEAELDGKIINSAINTIGRTFKRAKGSELPVISPVSNIFWQKEALIMRAIENEMRLSVIKAMKEFPNLLESLFKIQRPSVIPTGKKISVVEGIEIMEKNIFMPQYRLRPNEFGVKINGKQYVVETTPNLAATINNSNSFWGGGANAFLNTVRLPLYVMAQLYTKYSPLFIFWRNPVRDIQTALINAGVERVELGKVGKGLRQDIVKRIMPVIGDKLRRRIYNHLQGKEFDKEVDEFLRFGGKIQRWWQKDTLQAEKNLYQLEREMKNIGIEKPLNVIRNADKFLENISMAIELVPRFAFYQELVSRGMNKQVAAFKAADLTLAFHRQGVMSPFFKAFYLFFQPAIAGVSKTIRVLAAPGKKHTIPPMIGLMFLGYGMRQLSKINSQEGDRNLSRWRKQNTLSIAISEDKGITLFPLSYEWAWLYALGSNIADLQAGEVTQKQAIENVLISIIQNNMPIEEELGVFAVMPSVTRPFVETKLNQAWWGGRIHPDRFPQEVRKNYELYWQKTTSNQAKFMAQLMYDLSGGYLDVYPNDLEYLLAQYGGGPGSFLKQLGEGIGEVIEIGKQKKKITEFDITKMPFIYSFYYPIREREREKVIKEGSRMPLPPEILQRQRQGRIPLPQELR